MAPLTFPEINEIARDLAKYRGFLHADVESYMNGVMDLVEELRVRGMIDVRSFPRYPEALVSVAPGHRP
jgi:hypothetical protein